MESDVNKKHFCFDCAAAGRTQAGQIDQMIGGRRKINHGLGRRMKEGSAGRCEPQLSAGDLDATIEWLWVVPGGKLDG